MLDNDLIELLATRMELASATAGWNFPVVQKEQPTQQGIPTEPTIFLEKLFDNLYGFAARSNDIVTETDDFGPFPQMRETDKQLIETAFQISAWVIQDPTNTNLPTASDVVNYVSMFLRHRETIRAWAPLNVNLLRVTQIRNPYTEDDRHRNEATPSLDLILTHDRTLTLDVSSADTVVGDFYAIR